MKRVLEYLLIIFLRIILWFRYRLVFKGLDKLTPETIHKPGGVLFLPSHPAVFVDPIAVTLGAWKKYPIRPMVVEYMYYTPFIHSVMRFINAVPVPNFTTSSNSLKRKKTEAVMRTVVEGLKAKENFLIYPAGKVKLSHREVIGGASGVHQIIQEVPDVNIVLVRVKGLWGSSFSSYFGDKSLSLGEAIVQGIKICLKNLLFFTPRREVIVEFEPAPADFPYHGSRMDLNRYLEDWYNRPDGLTQQTGESPGDSLVLVSYSMWGEKYLEASKEKKLEDQSFKLEAIPEATKQKVVKKIAELAEVDPAKVALESNLAFDLGLDSLDIAELTAFLADEFDVKGIPVNQLTTVGHTLGIASRQIVCKEEVEEEEANISHWKQPVKRVQLEIAPGDTIAEVFLNNSAKMGKQIACGDTRSGILTYSQLRIRVLLLAEHIRHLPGQYIGVLLPASVAANVVILAIEVAGKIPLMINWTVGPRHLESVVKLSNVQAVLSSWAFLDKLENVELNGIEEKLVMLEDMRREFSLWKKFKAMMLSKFSTRSILKAFDIDKKEKSDPAVLLFTSGTENLPKGVPLSHNNLLSHLRAVLEVVDVYSDDVFFGILPPFHSFGFSVSCLLSVLSGLKVASSPDPTDGRRLALGVEKWGVTIVCGAPIFLKGMLKAATPEQLSSLRLCVTGAEKAPQELFDLMKEFNKEDSLIEGYGITECSPVLTVNPIIGAHRGVGQPLSCVELAIVHPETFEAVPIGDQGLILARGSNVFHGYINPDVASPFIQHEGKEWYVTGDLGFLDKDGYLTISGRLKRFIKIGGEMISLASIEDALSNKALKENSNNHAEGPLLAVSAKESVGDKVKIVLFSTFPANVDEINDFLRKSGFSNLARISSIIQVKEIPLMGSGKTNYRVLEAEYLNRLFA